MAPTVDTPAVDTPTGTATPTPAAAPAATTSAAAAAPGRRRGGVRATLARRWPTGIGISAVAASLTVLVPLGC